MRPTRTALAMAVGIVLTSAAVPLAHAAPTVPAGTPTNIIVMVEPGRLSDAERAIEALGGEIGRQLPIINGFAGSVPSDLVDRLVASDAVASVTADVKVTAMAADAALGYESASTASLSAISRISGAQAMWNAGFVGKGVDVALIDTGVTRVPGLNRTGQIVDGPDLSFDAIEPALISRDAFGHGTHMAGIIAGSDVAPGASAKGCKTCLGPSAYTNTNKFVGIAPEARIINVKVGAFDGATDVSQVIAGIDWVVQHRRDPGFNIRVLNLSFGTDSAQNPRLDPLVRAADVAWSAGIVVVAAAGNDGLLTSSLASPALSPAIIAVGATDPMETVDIADDRVASFAQHGNGNRQVDFVAPGVSVISLRVPGSFVDQNVTTGKVGTRFQQASGTSQSTAVVSGLAALLVSKFPTASPDTIKAYLTNSAHQLGFASSPLQLNALNHWYDGAGSVDVAGAASLKALPTAATVVPTSTGLGLLEAARGTSHVSNGTTMLVGEKDIFGKAWDATKMAQLTTQMATWTGGRWNGSQWTGDGWSGARWSTTQWTSADWSGARWSDAVWSSMVWDGARWSGARWSGARWSSGTWEGARWSGARWSDAHWG